MTSEANKIVLTAAQVVVRSSLTQASESGSISLTSADTTGFTTEIYDWCVEKLKTACNGHWIAVANEMEIHKAMTYMSKRDFNRTITSLQGLEDQHQEAPRLASAAATNLSFYHFCQNEFDQALEHAEKACEIDRFNASSVINRGCCMLQKGTLEAAIGCFRDALALDPSRLDALYNLGLSLRKNGQAEEALHVFEKLFKAEEQWNKVRD